VADTLISEAIGWRRYAYRIKQIGITVDVDRDSFVSRDTQFYAIRRQLGCKFLGELRKSGTAQVHLPVRPQMVLFINRQDQCFSSHSASLTNAPRRTRPLDSGLPLQRRKNHVQNFLLL